MSDDGQDSAPRRLKQLAQKESYTGTKLSPEDVQKILDGRFAFVNVWRNIRDDSPVMVKPLAVCDPASVVRDSHMLYELLFADRTGNTYSLPYSDKHRWYYYPRMEKDECLVFKVMNLSP